MESWEGSQLNAAKVILADECTKLLHGEECLAQIHATVQSLYGSGSDESDLDSLPKFYIDNTEVEKINSNSGLSVVDILVKAGFASSKSEAKRLIKGGGARVNGEKVDDENALLSVKDFGTEGRLKLSSGKKKHALVLIQ